jgi:hypothetical protein
LDSFLYFFRWLLDWFFWYSFLNNRVSRLFLKFFFNFRLYDRLGLYDRLRFYDRLRLYN